MFIRRKFFRRFRKANGLEIARLYCAVLLSSSRQNDRKTKSTVYLMTIQCGSALELRPPLCTPIIRHHSIRVHNIFKMRFIPTEPHLNVLHLFCYPITNINRMNFEFTDLNYISTTILHQIIFHRPNNYYCNTTFKYHGLVKLS